MGSHLHDNLSLILLQWFPDPWPHTESSKFILKMVFENLILQLIILFSENAECPLTPSCAAHEWHRPPSNCSALCRTERIFSKANLSAPLGRLGQSPLKSRWRLSSVTWNHCGTWALWRLGNDLGNHMAVWGEVHNHITWKGWIMKEKFRFFFSDRPKISCASGFLCLRPKNCVLIILQVLWMRRWEGKRRPEEEGEENSELMTSALLGSMDVWYDSVIVADSLKMLCIGWEDKAFCLRSETRFRVSHHPGVFYRLQLVSFLCSPLKFTSAAWRRSSISRVQDMSQPPASSCAGD